MDISGGEGEDVVIHEGHKKYNILKRRDTDELIKRIQVVAKNNPTYKEVEKSLETMEEDEDNDNISQLCRFSSFFPPCQHST